MYCGVPKNLAAFSASLPNASLPNAPRSSARRWCSAWIAASLLAQEAAATGVFSAIGLLPLRAHTTRERGGWSAPASDPVASAKPAGGSADPSLGLADATVIAWAERHERKVLTLEQRHFGAVARKGKIEILPT